MSELDYTKKSRLSNIYRRLRAWMYEFVFLARTRYEKWLLYTSLCFGLAGTAVSLCLVTVVSRPAPIMVSCDMDMIKEVLSASAPATKPAEKAPKVSPKSSKKTRSTAKKPVEKNAIKDLGG